MSESFIVVRPRKGRGPRAGKNRGVDRERCEAEPGVVRRKYVPKVGQAAKLTKRLPINFTLVNPIAVGGRYTESTTKPPAGATAGGFVIVC